MLQGRYLPIAFAVMATADEAQWVVIAERNMIVAFDPATGAGTQEGTFHAAGAISDTGTATADFTITPIGHDRASLRGDRIPARA